MLYTTAGPLSQAGDRRNEFRSRFRFRFRTHLKKRILVQNQGGREVQPGGILLYFEDLNRAPNAEFGPKDFFEMGSTEPRLLYPGYQVAPLVTEFDQHAVGLSILDCRPMGGPRWHSGFEYIYTFCYEGYIDRTAWRDRLEAPRDFTAMPPSLHRRSLQYFTIKNSFLATF